MKIQLNLDEYVRRQRDEMFSPFHRWVTGEKVGHDPTHNDLAEYWVRSGAARDFSDRYEIKTETKQQESLCHHSELFGVPIAVVA